MTTIRMGNKIITDFENHVKAKNPSLLNQVQVQATTAQMKMFDIHARAIGCLCECLGMNAENSIAVCNGSRPPFSDIDYDNTLEKWGLVDEKGEPII